MPNDNFFNDRHDFEKREFSTPLKEQLPSDFKSSVLFGPNLKIKSICIDDLKKIGIGYITRIELVSESGYTILNAQNPLPLDWIAIIQYGIFGYPVDVVVNDCIPENIRTILHKALVRSLIYEK